MASHSEPRIITFKADAAIAKGKAVKIGTDKEHVAAAAAATDKMIGIAQSAASAAEDLIEVALPGGGAKGLAGDTIAAGDVLTYHASGLDATTTGADRYVGIALESAVAGDLFAVEVVLGLI